VMVYEHAMHLVKVAERKEEVLTPLDEVREELEKRVLGKKRRAALQGLAKKLRETAKIERIDNDGGEN